MLNSVCRLFCAFALFFLPFAAPAAPPPENGVLVLPNGLRVILRERHNRPLAAIDLWVRAGAREQRDEEAGAAHLLEHTLFKGTASRKAGQLDFELESLGGIFTAATGPDFAHFSTTLPANSLAAALPLFADLVRNATLPAAEIERERSPILDELAQRGDEAETEWLAFAYEAAFAKHAYRHTPGGTPADIKARSRETLAAFYARTYAPERCTLVIAGDFETAKVRAVIEKAFGDWKPGLPADNPAAEPEPTAAHTALVRTAGKTERITIAFRVPPATDKEATRALRLLDALLGESGSQGLLNTPALAGTNAAVHYTPRLDASLFLLTAAVPPEIGLTKIEAALVAVIEDLQTVQVSRAQLNAARQQMISQNRYDSETNGGLARLLGYADLTHGEPPEELSRGVSAVTAAMIQKAAGKWFDANRRVTVYMNLEKAK